MVVAAGPLALTAHAQTGATSDSVVTFLPRSSFHMTAARVGSDDERFVWDTNFGGSLDLVDYGAGRFIFEANYQAILGEEFRPFDPNQGNYILAGSLSARLPRVEVSGVFYHQSRHLSDRPKRQPVDWNMLGVRLQTEATRGPVRVTARGDVRGTVQRSFVDYRWEVDAESRLEYRVSSPLSVFAGGGLRLLGTDGSAGRGRQTGSAGEGGVRLRGGGGAVELFVRVERRIDPYPLEFGTATWAMAGFRLLSR
jgi:hypothetical protein